MANEDGPSSVYARMMKQRLVVAAVMLAGSSAQAGVIDLASELRAIAAKSPAPAAPRLGPVAAKGCTALGKAERAALEKRALAWIDTQHPDERGLTSSGGDGLELVVNIGCVDPAGAAVLDVSQDREPKKRNPDTFSGLRRNYLLRATATAIDVLAEDVSSSSQSWMEWADEGRISLLAQLDVDGDGALDVVYSDHEHEGGAIDEYDLIHVRFANGTLGHSGQVTNLADIKIVGGQLAVAGQTRAGGAVYACLERDLHLTPCLAVKALQTAADRRAIVERFAQADAGSLPDREQLAQDLAVLGIRARRRAELVAAAPETTPGDRVQRKVTAFLVKAKLVEPAPMPEVITQSHAEASTYLTDLATKLGDTPCTPSALTDDDKARAMAWVKKQDAKAVDISIAAASCGPYTWVAWWPNPNGDPTRRQVLLGRDGARILGFTYALEMPIVEVFGHAESWFTHDGTVVGVAIGGPNLWVIANGKVVAQSKGDKLEFYRADDRFRETSSDVFLDGGTLWHATPTGRERLDLALVRDHEARRAAIALAQTPPTGAAKYIAALTLLGADAALIAECKKLP